jgi:hypothetical protein
MEVGTLITTVIPHQLDLLIHIEIVLDQIQLDLLDKIQLDLLDEYEKHQTEEEVQVDQEDIQVVHKLINKF